MGIGEVFPNPTVQGVHFEMRFPNLFYIERKIGDLQVKIMKRFPESQLILRRQLVFADVGPEGTMQPPPCDSDSEVAKKVWSFKSPTGVEVNVLGNSLQIHSTHHKTYNNPESQERFREVIEYVVPHFLELTGVPVITRIGLRYIDKCPIPKLENEVFQEWYNTAFPLKRFSLSDAIDMAFNTTVRKGGFFVRYVEALKLEQDTPFLILDFDGFAEQIEAGEYLKVTDGLHELISSEFEATIREPVYGFMRGGGKE